MQVERYERSTVSRWSADKNKKTKRYFCYFELYETLQSILLHTRILSRKQRLECEAVPSSRGGFGGLSPSKQSSNPPKNETWNTINKWRFGKFIMSSPPAQTKTPRRTAKPPIENCLATVLMWRELENDQTLERRAEDIQWWTSDC